MARSGLTAIAMCIMLGACAQEPTPEQVANTQAAEAKRQELIAAECKLYKGSGVTPPECKK